MNVINRTQELKALFSYEHKVELEEKHKAAQIARELAESNFKMNLNDE